MNPPAHDVVDDQNPSNVQTPTNFPNPENPALPMQVDMTNELSANAYRLGNIILDHARIEADTRQLHVNNSLADFVPCYLKLV